MTSLILDSLYAWLGVFVLPRWLVLAPRSRRYRAGLLQRLGLAPELARSGRRVWFHCASVGEAGIPGRLVEMIGSADSEIELVFSACTDTGVERLRALYPDCEVFFWPLDLSASVRASIKRVKPSALVLVEQEIWPNMLMRCRRLRIPVAIVNGRMNRLSSVLVRCIFRLIPDACDAIRLCCVRSADDAQLFTATGIPRERIVHTGSLKYDTLKTDAGEEKTEKLRKLFSIEPGARVLVGGSTHRGEEEALARVWDRLRSEFPGIRLILVPRHIERAQRLAASLRESGLRAELKSGLNETDGAAGADTIIIVDTIGELVSCYALADIVFVGRSLYPPGGGQNMMEPAALGKPVLLGPHTGNFKPEMQMLASSGAVWTVETEAQLEDAVRRLLEDGKQAGRLGARARSAVLQNRGAAARTYQELARTLKWRRDLSSPPFQST